MPQRGGFQLISPTFLSSRHWSARASSKKFHKVQKIRLTPPACKRKPRLTNRAQMAELVDALASGASVRMDVEVRVLFWAPSTHVDRSTNPDSFKVLISMRNVIEQAYIRPAIPGDGFASCQQTEDDRSRLTADNVPPPTIISNGASAPLPRLRCQRGAKPTTDLTSPCRL